MGNFKRGTKNRSWMGTVHIANMEKAGLSKEQYENPEFLAEFLMDIWNNSGKGRTSGVAVCVSLKGCYHAHVALYGNLTTLGNVSKIMFDSHIEPQLGGKKELKNYLAKEPPYDEKGEQVLCIKGLDNVQDVQGQRSDLEEIEDLLQQGYSPSEIMEISFSYRKYEKMIKSAFIDKRIKETPLIKETHNEWHVGEAGSGKTYYYYQLCERYSPEKIYMATDFENGGFDFYIEQGAPPILFIDEFKGNMEYGRLLTILDKYSRVQTHCRYTNTYNLWTTCIITSVFPPEIAYEIMLERQKRSNDDDENTLQEIDTLKQLLRRLDLIVYHYVHNGEYKTFSMAACDYQNYNDLCERALTDKNGFTSIIADMEKDIPF